MVYEIKQKALWKKFEENMLNQGASDKRIKKLNFLFKVFEKGMEVDFEKAKREHIEKFINKLNRDEILSSKGKKFAGNSKSDLKKFVRQFYKWLRGDNESFPPEVSWIKTKIRKDEQPKEKDVLSLKEVKALSDGFVQEKYSILVLLLFDSGFRIQEMLSVNKRDLTWEEFTDNEECFWIKCNKSKTIARKVPVPLFTPEIQRYVNSLEYKNKSDGDKLFDMDYNAIRMAMKRKSAALLGKEITPHHLRHSSATYYAMQYDGNMVLISQRYGWSYSSDELKTYIRNSGAYQKAGAKKVYENETTKLKKELIDIKKKVNSLYDILLDDNKTEVFRKNLKKSLT